MEYLNKLLKFDPFSYENKDQDDVFFNAVIENFNHQIKNSPEYNMWASANNIYSSSDIENLHDLPFFPSNIFKYLSLSSSSEGFKTIQSSGTTSQAKSKIYLDKENAKRQTTVLAKILSNLLGKKRKPFLIVDADARGISKNNKLTARFAGMSGYLMAASSRNYILDEVNEKLELDYLKLQKTILDHHKKNQPIVIIGYTYLVFEKLLEKLEKSNFQISCPKGTIFVHFGGWKKLKQKQVSKKKLNSLISKYLGIASQNIIDIYGFTEQLGTVYPSIGSKGCMVPAYSHVIVRDTESLKPVNDGVIGFLQFITPIALSYPGLSVINDDLGKIVSRNDHRVEFEVIGRPEDSEPRGCGDTLPENFLI